MALSDWLPWVGVAAFGLSVVNTIWNIRRDVRDKGCVRVDAVLGHLISQCDDPPAEQFENEWLTLTATNIGRRPVTIKGFYGVVNAKKHMFLMPSQETREERLSTPMPAELKEGQSAQCIIPADGMKKEPVQYFFVTDTHNREWKSRRNPLRARGKRAAAADTAK